MFFSFSVTLTLSRSPLTHNTHVNHKKLFSNMRLLKIFRNWRGSFIWRVRNWKCYLKHGPLWLLLYYTALPSLLWYYIVLLLLCYIVSIQYCTVDIVLYYIVLLLLCYIELLLSLHFIVLYCSRNVNRLIFNY